MPDWSDRLFLILDPSGRWAGPIQTQIMADLQPQARTHQSGQITCETCTTVREINALCDAANVCGLILFFHGLEREILGFLRTVWNRCPHLQVLVVAESQHADLVPVLLESGVSQVLLDIHNDLPIARWALQTLPPVTADRATESPRG